MMVATVVSGACMFGVHPFSQLVPKSEYGVFAAMIGVLNCLTIPSVGLQMVFARQTAAAVSEEQRRQLAGTVRGVLCATFLLWLVALVLVAAFQTSVIEQWKLSHPAVLWLTLISGLLLLWKPICGGVIQGQQNFLWFGWAAILEGASRVVGVAVIVLLWRRDAVAMVLGVLIGSVAGILVLAWQSRATLQGSSLPVAWKSWAAQVVPLTLGFGSFQFMFGADPLFVQGWFGEEETPAYMAAGTLSRALVTFTGPLVWVMFPKIVRSMTVREKTNVFWLGLAATGVLVSLGALALSIVAPIVVPIVYGDRYAETLPLLRLFPWSLVPLVLGNVLMNDLLARQRYRVVPWLVGVAVLYAAALCLWHQDFFTVIRVLGLCNIAFLTVLLLFFWKNR